MFEFFDAIIEFITSGIYDLIVGAFSYMVQALTVASIEFTIWSTGFAWDIAKDIIEDIGLSDALNQAWSDLDSDLLSTATYFGIPDGINLVLNAAVTKYTLRFIPFA